MSSRNGKGAALCVLCVELRAGDRRSGRTSTTVLVERKRDKRQEARQEASREKGLPPCLKSTCSISADELLEIQIYEG